MSEIMRSPNPDIDDNQANPEGEEKLHVLKYEQGEDGLEEIAEEKPDVDKLYGAGEGQPLSREERQELDKYVREVEEKRKQWEKDKDPTLLGKFLEKAVNNRFFKVVIPAFLIWGYSHSMDQSDARAETKQTLEEGALRVGEQNEKNKKTAGELKEVIKDLSDSIPKIIFGEKKISFSKVKEGETRPVITESETSKMVVSEPEKVSMKWARSYDVDKMEEGEVEDLTGKIDKIIDKFLSENNLTLEDLQKLKDQGVKNELVISGLASPEGDESKNEEVKEGRAKLAKKLTEDRLEEKGLSDFFDVVDDTREGGDVFVDGEGEGKDGAFEKRKQAFSVDNERDLLDLIKKYNRGDLSETDMTSEQAKLMKEVFDNNRGVSIQFVGGVIEINPDIDFEKDPDSVEEVEFKIPTLTPEWPEPSPDPIPAPIPDPTPKPTPDPIPEVPVLREVDKGVFEQHVGVQDPQIYEDLPLGKKKVEINTKDIEEGELEKIPPEPRLPDPLFPPPPPDGNPPPPIRVIDVEPDTTKAGLREIQSMRRGRLGKKELEKVATGTGHGKGKERPKKYYRSKVELDGSGEVVSLDQQPQESSRSPKSKIKRERVKASKERTKKIKAERKFVRGKKGNS